MPYSKQIGTFKLKIGPIPPGDPSMLEERRYSVHVFSVSVIKIFFYYYHKCHTPPDRQLIPIKRFDKFGVLKVSSNFNLYKRIVLLLLSELFINMVK